MRREAALALFGPLLLGALSCSTSDEPGPSGQGGSSGNQPAGSSGASGQSGQAGQANQAGQAGQPGLAGLGGGSGQAGQASQAGQGGSMGQQPGCPEQPSPGQACDEGALPCDYGDPGCSARCLCEAGAWACAPPAGPGCLGPVCPHDAACGAACPASLEGQECSCPGGATCTCSPTMAGTTVWACP